MGKKAQGLTQSPRQTSGKGNSKRPHILKGTGNLVRHRPTRKPAIPASANAARKLYWDGDTMEQMGKIGETMREGVRGIFTLGTRRARTDQQDQQPAPAGQTGRNGDEWSMGDATSGFKGEREYVTFGLRGRESPTNRNRDHITETDWTPPHHMLPGALREEIPEDKPKTTTTLKP